MNTSGMWTLNLKDLARGAVVAILTGILLPLAAAVQTPGFELANVNWHQVLILAINGAVVGFAGYLTKNLASDSEGKVFGKIG